MYWGDWSSDVCSADLRFRDEIRAVGREQGQRDSDPLIEITLSLLTPYGAYLIAEPLGVSGILAIVAAEIGRASCRKRGQILGGVGAPVMKYEFTGGQL